MLTLLSQHFLLPIVTYYLYCSQSVFNILPDFINSVCISKQACRFVGVWQGPESAK